MSSEITSVIKGAISELPEDDKKAVTAAYEALKKVVTDAGDAGLMAIALLGSELAE